MTTAVLEQPAVARPRARGWIHFYSAIAAGLVSITLFILAATLRDGVAAVAVAVYGLTVVGMFSVSATYHRHTWVSPVARTWMKRADHSMIFLFIAGTYTPIALLGLPDSESGWVLITVWTGALGGVALKVIWPHAPRWVGVPFYIGLGWVAIFVMPELAEAGVAGVVLIAAGGLLYTGGAVIYAIKRPNPWPGTFGYHEVFHAAVSLAAVCHCVAIWLLLLG